MNKLFRPILMGFMGLALIACNKTDDLRPEDKPNTAPSKEAVSSESKTTLFNLSANLGGVNLLGLPNAGAGLQDDEELRADINFNGTTSAPKVTTMSLLHTYFGERMEDTAVKAYPNAPAHKLNARWGILYGSSNTPLGINCTVSDNQEPSNPSTQTKNLVVLKNGADGVSIREAQIRMYCQFPTNLQNEEKKFAFMCLDGVEGKTEATQTRQYFNGSFTDNGKTYVCDTDPNGRIEGLTEDLRVQKDRHIPIMSDVVAFDKLANATASSEREKLSPRGSFMGLCVKNELGEDITLTHIVVKPAESVFDYAGYFDWSNAGKAVFHAEAPTSQTVTGEYAFPVYSKGANTVGYAISKTETKNPCFYVWGFQRAAKKGEPFDVQLRFKNGKGDVFTTKVFTIDAPTNKAGTKEFQDGFAYHSLLAITKSNFSFNGGNNDWNGNGGFLPNNGGSSTNNGSSSYGGESVSLGFKTPLDFVAEAPAINKTGDAFVKNHDLPTQNVVEYMENYEVGYFNWEQAKALFNKDWLKTKYYLPTREQWQSIVPYYGSGYVYFSQTHDKYTITEDAQIGETAKQSYTSEYITVKEDNLYVTYGVRFKNTDWVSAWRYSYEGESSKKKMVVKCVPLKGKPNALLDITKIAKSEFFTTNACSIRTFPAYGYRSSNTATTVSNLGSYGYYWSISPNSSSYAYYLYFDSSGAYVIYGGYRSYGFPVRPFVRN